MYSAETIEVFLRLVRVGIGNDSSRQVVIPDNIDWVELKTLADAQGLTAVALDGLNLLNFQPTTVSQLSTLNSQLKLEWIGEVLQNYEQRYNAYERAIGSLAGWYNQHGFRMMVLKGYACSLDWSKPNHRLCGDIDIWLFGQQREADALLESSEFRVESLESVKKVQSIKVDNSHHHHTVFEWEGFTVENHYDFVNVHHHKSNVKLDQMLKELAADDSNVVEIDGEKVIFPSVDFNAFFLLRHAMNHFASSEITIRQLLDWAFFVKNHSKEIDWKLLEKEIEQFGMKELYNVFNAICVGDLGFSPEIFGTVQFNQELKDKVFKEIITPEVSGAEPSGLIRRIVFKFHRWKANGWKHALCYKESMWSAFWSGVWSHLLKPKSI